MSDLPDNYDDLTDVEKIEDVHFPELKGGNGYEVKSPATIEYNCLSWALGINWTRYDPEPECAGYYWFPGIDREWSLKAISQTLEKHGYGICDSSDLEDGFEKVAIYIDASDTPAHFARQLPTGKWTSKIGDLNDIEHDTLECLATPDYGKPQLVMKRPRPTKDSADEGEVERDQ